MTDETTGEWVECVADKDYEIWNQEPFPIRRKGTDRIIREGISYYGYVSVSLNQKNYLKHRIIALQFIPNDEPDDKPFIDHQNRNRADNRLTNLRWVSAKENSKNKTSNKSHQYNFIDELPNTAEPLEQYNNHELDDLYIDYGTQKLYLFNSINYRELLEHHTQNSIYYITRDRNGKECRMYHSKLFN